MEYVQQACQSPVAIGAATVVVGGAIAATYLLTPPPGKPVPKMQSVRLAAEREGESHIYRCGASPDKLVAQRWDDVSTLYENFRRGVRISPQGKCLGWREGDGPFQWYSYAEVESMAHAIGSGLIELGFEPRDLVGVYMKNRPEWIITEQACNAYSYPVVPLYDTLGKVALDFILSQTEMRVVICTAEKLESLFAGSEEATAHLKYIVTLDEVTDENHIAMAEEKGIQLLTFGELEERGRKAQHEPVPPKPSDLCTICYTSGTTDLPKGVMLTHANIVADWAGLAATLGSEVFHKSDVHISYLPLAHIFERMVVTGMLANGGSIGFFRGNVLQLFDDIAVLRPTVFPSVPRLYNRLYDKVLGQLNQLTGVKKKLFEKAWQAKLEGLRHGRVKHPLWDALVFRKVANKLGGRIRLMITGSAPINAEVMDFLRICFSCDVLEGYGQTETSAGSTATLYGDTTTGHVGRPIASNELKLVDVPEMNYYASADPPRGEICFRGNNCFVGYFKNEKATSETIDEDGWVHSGDIGIIHENGTLTIIDRKKNIFKLAQGEYIAPEKIEGYVVKSPYIAQVFVYGNSLKASLVAIVVPDQEVLLPWAKEHGLGDLSLEELCAKSEVKKLMMQSIDEMGSKYGLQSFEKPRDIHICAVPFSEDQGLLTPTMKLKRPQAKEYFQDEIDAMYTKLP
ncbi:Long-chain-fatty-acid--CoA ligase 1 [Balamuthia mandrillaris]